MLKADCFCLSVSTEIQPRKPLAVWHTRCTRGDITHWCVVPVSGLASLLCVSHLWVYWYLRQVPQSVPGAWLFIAHVTCDREVTHSPAAFSLCGSTLRFPKRWAVLFCFFKTLEPRLLQSKRDFPDAFIAPVAWTVLSHKPDITSSFYHRLDRGTNVIISSCHRASFWRRNLFTARA